MSNAKKFYRLGCKLRSIVESRMFKVSFIFILSLLFSFGVLNIYAQGNVPSTITPDWGGEKRFHNVVNDVEGDNSQTSLGIQNVTALWTGVLYLGGGDILDEGTKQRLESSNVPHDLKRGILGMTEDTATAIYANYPLVNIPDHLAQQWVPGYKESVTALYAQESGYDELQAAGIQPMWTQVLNIAYIFFVVVMIIAGFMIMFRHKIGGQALVTLGNVLPNVIISLVVATFSFAIAGLIIDFGGLLISLIVDLFGLSGSASSISGFGDLVSNVFTGGVKVTGLASGVVGALGIGSFIGKYGLAIGAAASGPVGWVIGGAVGVVGLLIALIILGIITFGAIKTLITLFKAYFQLLFSVVLGPLQITLGAIPGKIKEIMN